MENLAQDLENELWQLPKVDVHCHLSPGQLTATKPEELIFYHFLWREYLAAGAKREDFADKSPQQRLELLAPLWERISQTSAVWCLKEMAKGLYGLEGELVEVIPALAQKVASGPWPWEELRAKLNLEAAYACGPVWEAEQLKGKEEIVRPMLELLNFGSHQLSFLKEMLGGSSLKESRERLTKFVHKQVRAGVRHFAGFIGNDFIYTPISPLRLADIYQRPSSELAEANGLATYYLDAFLEAVGQAGGMAQFYLGSKWNLPGMENGESYPIVSHRLVPSLVTLFRRHPGTKVSIMNATAALGQELTVMARMLNNVSLAGFWWHALNPPYIRRQIEERLSLLPLNKWVLLTTDSYNLEWCYGKIALAIHCLAQVLARKIAEGDLGRKEALQIGKWLLYQAPSEIYER